MSDTMSGSKRIEKCKSCDLRNSNLLICKQVELQNSINELKHKIPLLRLTEKDVKCPAYWRNIG